MDIALLWVAGEEPTEFVDDTLESVGGAAAAVDDWELKGLTAL